MQYTPKWARTTNLRLRRPLLYPVELSVHRTKGEGFEPSIRDKPYTRLAGERLQPLGHPFTAYRNCHRVRGCFSTSGERAAFYASCRNCARVFFHFFVRRDVFALSRMKSGGESWGGVKLWGWGEALKSSGSELLGEKR